MNPETAYLGWEPLDLNGQDGVVLVGAWRDVVDAYVQAVEGLGQARILEPRSVALARAVGYADVVLVDWTGERVQVVVVEGHRVTFSTSRTVPAAVTESTPRLASFIAVLIPKGSARRGPLPSRLVLLGELYGRHDVAEDLDRQPGFPPFEVEVEWQPPAPFGRFAAACQAATIGALLRDKGRAQSSGRFPAINLMIERKRIVQPRPVIRPQFLIALAVAAVFLAVVVGIQIVTLAGTK